MRNIPIPSHHLTPTMRYGIYHKPRSASSQTRGGIRSAVQRLVDQKGSPSLWIQPKYDRAMGTPCKDLWVSCNTYTVIKTKTPSQTVTERNCSENCCTQIDTRTHKRGRASATQKRRSGSVTQLSTSNNRPPGADEKEKPLEAVPPAHRAANSIETRGFSAARHHPPHD